MFDGILFISVIFAIIKAIKDACEKPIPAENWANKELYHKDIMDGVSIEQRMKNLENGKYKMVNTYPEPHRDPVSGGIIIENNLLYENDLINHGAYQTMQWAKQGKYNLTPEELKKENERLKAKYERLIRY